MPELNPHALKISITREPPLSLEEARGFAALLLRTGMDLQIVSGGGRDVEIAYGGAGMERSRWTRKSQADRRRVLEVLKQLDAREELEIPLPDLPLVYTAVLEGWDEEDAQLDEHGRPRPEDSFAMELGAIDRPFLDEIAQKFGRLLYQRAGRKLPQRKCVATFCATLDIDSAGMFRGRAAARNLLAIARETPRRILTAGSLAARSAIGAGRDPHLRIRSLTESMEGMGVPATVFVQTHRRHQLDSYDLSSSPRLTKEIAGIASNPFHTIGLHSSYATRDAQPRFFMEQWQRLRRATKGKAAPVHRAHYLRVPPRLDYWSPWRMDIVDSSLGFGAHEGFRRGTSFPFRPAEGIIEQPPVVMDTTLRLFRGLSAEQAFERNLELLDRVSQVGGVFVPIVHLNCMDEFLWPGWSEAFLDLLGEARRRGVRFQSLASAARKLQARADLLERTFQETRP